MVETFRFLKGHGTENDFVVLPDHDGQEHRDLSASLVSALCSRRAGIGGDGVLRVVRTDAYDDPAAAKCRGAAEWFMDYRNADGSVSQMCGNGVRVVARYLADYAGVRVDRPLAIGSRDGVKTVSFSGSGEVTVDMGSPVIGDQASVAVGERTWPAQRVDMGNPHAVALVIDLAEAGSLATSPSYDPEVFPEGVNIEFAVRRGASHVAMRVHERGVGETRSCGTGACAVAVTCALDAGRGPGASYTVDVLGGRLLVEWTQGNRLLLTGPAVIVAEGEVSKSFARSH